MLWGKGCAAFLFLLLLIPVFCSQEGIVFASASTREAPASGQFCIPFLPWWPCPSPTPGKSPTPTLTLTPGVSPTATATHVSGNTPTPTPTTTPGSGKPKIVTAPGSFIVQATRIVATNAHLQLFPDPLHPTLFLQTATIDGLKLTRQVGNAMITLSATGTANGTGVAIKTSIFRDIQTALASFANKADLLVLASGGTVKTLVMTNVTLYVDRSMTSNSLSVGGLMVMIG
jgi:hypothetical protein